MRLARVSRSSRAITSSTACPAAQATLLPPNVLNTSHCA
jgi:hypothetical protein